MPLTEHLEILNYYLDSFLGYNRTVKFLTLAPSPRGLWQFTAMPCAISSLTRMHLFFSRPATLKPVAIFLKTPPRSELPSSFSLKTPWPSFFSLTCITAATSKFRFVTPSQPWGPRRSWGNPPLILSWSYQFYTNIVKGLSCHGPPPITWWWSTFHQCFNLKTSHNCRGLIGHFLHTLP